VVVTVSSDRRSGGSYAIPSKAGDVFCRNPEGSAELARSGRASTNHCLLAQIILPDAQGTAFLSVLLVVSLLSARI